MLSRLRPGEGGPPSRVEPLLKKVRSYNPKADLKELQAAFRFAEASTRARSALSGEDFIEHPLAVADILADLRLDSTTLEAALLHDTVEDTAVTLDDIEEEFGDEVARIVDGLTKLDRFKFRTREQQQAENVRKMIVAMAGDIRVLLIKLADRLHNMRTLGALAAPASSARSPPRPSRSTRRWRTAWASRRSSGSWRTCRSRRCTRARITRSRTWWTRAAASARRSIDDVTTALRAKLKELGMKADVEGRPKHLYSIYEKMVIRGKEFNEIYDLVGIRVQVESLRDCYGALGAVHALWKPVPGRFKDYIAMPKNNMYQSLHTTVVGPRAAPLEIQIRTRDMHRTAQYGIAAHWRYKEGSKQAKEAADLAWLGQMMDWLKDMADPREFMEGLRIDLSGGRVFVFTPEGRRGQPAAGRHAGRLRLRHPHRRRAPHASARRWAGKLVPLDYELRTGDSVEILDLEAQGEGPSQDWLQFVPDPARAQQDPPVVRAGAPRGRPGARQGRAAAAHAQAERAVQTPGDRGRARPGGGGAEVPRPRLALCGAGRGPRVAAVGRGPALPARSRATPEEDVDGGSARPAGADREARRCQGVVVRGLPRRLGAARSVLHAGAGRRDHRVRHARARACRVHRTDCPNVKALEREPERLIEVTWAEGKPTSFTVAIQVEALDRTRLLSDVATVLSDHHVNILAANSSTGRDRITRLRFTFEMADIAHLSSVLAAVKRVESVFDALPGGPQLACGWCSNGVDQASVTRGRRPRGLDRPRATCSWWAWAPTTAPARRSRWRARSRTCGSSPTTTAR